MHIHIHTCTYVWLSLSPCIHRRTCTPSPQLINFMHRLFVRLFGDLRRRQIKLPKICKLRKCRAYVFTYSKSWFAVADT